MEKKFIFFLYPFFLYANYSGSGPHEVVISGDNYTLSNGQSIEYTLYTPADINHVTQVTPVSYTHLTLPTTPYV